MSGTDRTFLGEMACREMLEDSCVPFTKSIMAHTAAEAVEAARTLGFPVVLKVVSPDIVHKSDLGGVALGIGDSAGVTAAWAHIRGRVFAAAPLARLEGMIVAAEAPPGVDLIVGVVTDPTFGVTLMVGMGGVLTEMLGDVSFRVLPFERYEARRMLEELEGYQILTGTRGRPPSDVEAVVDLLHALSKIMPAFPEIEELDLNPVRVLERGVLVLDSRAFLRASGCL